MALISGFLAKSVASGHFIDYRSLEIIENGDNDFSPIFFSRNQIDDKEKIATATVFGFKKRNHKR